MTPETIIDLIRHGEPEGGRMIRGHGVDHPLSTLGWAQMRGAVGTAPVDRTRDWDQIISSPMARCREFAMELARQRGLPLAVDPQLREVGMGAWEGSRPEELAQRNPADYEAFLHDPVGHRPPGGERLDALIARVGAAYDGHLRAYPGRRLLLVCHAGVSRAIIGHLLRAEPAQWYRLRIDYAGLTRIRHGRHGAIVEYINAHRLR